ncbi:MAG: hypothetical protein GY756_06155 [bacterium]|nr:hypothetical protein [bacterium]
MENNQQPKLQTDDINISKLETYYPPRVDLAPLDATHSGVPGTVENSPHTAAATS